MEEKEKPVKFTLRFKTRQQKEDYDILIKEVNGINEPKSIYDKKETLTGLILETLNKKANAIRKKRKED